MEDIIRSSDLTATMQKLKVADEKITELTAELANWKLMLDVNVEPGAVGYGLSVRARKPNGTGFTLSIDPETVMYYLDDAETLSKSVIERIFEQLYKNEIRNIVSPAITRAVQNVKRLGKSKL